MQSFRILISVLALLMPQLAHAQWTSSGREASYAMYMPQANKPETHAIILVSYERRWACQPAVSVMVVAGRKLGSPDQQLTEKRREKQLSVIVDGKHFTNETKITMYSNGVEFAMLAPPGLIDALKTRTSTVHARLGTGLGGFDFSDGKGFVAANAAAASNCN